MSPENSSQSSGEEQEVFKFIQCVYLCTGVYACMCVCVNVMYMRGEYLAYLDKVHVVVPAGVWVKHA